MVQWRCFCCNKDLVACMVELELEGLKGSVEGIKCPSCGTQYVLEDVAMEKLRLVEEETSSK
jgi:hypothetical protein